MAMSSDTLTDLLVSRATEGLDADRARRVDSIADGQVRRQADSLERAAAAIHLAALSTDLDAMPAALRTRLTHEADALFGEAVSVGPQDTQADGRADVVPLGAARAAPALRPTRLPWLAAAAALLIAVAAWWPEMANRTPDFAEQRARLIGAGAIVIDWTATEDPTAAMTVGDVVWDPVSQTGFMRFEGLQANSPTEFQYQLWIFDALRDERYPVDGGVFDIPAGADEVIVPIAARLPVTDATLFAVTVERPGGVVVSSRERIAVLAQAG